MEKINFKNRILKNPRKRKIKNLSTQEIIDVELQDDPSNIQTDSDTPINAETLNLMQNNVETAINMSKTEAVNEAVGTANQHTDDTFNNLNITSSMVSHDEKRLNDIIDLRGSIARFSKTDTQTVPLRTTTTIKFNQTVINDDGCFELLSDGTIKIKKDIKRIIVTANIRTSPVPPNIYLYVGNVEFSNIQRAANGYTDNCIYNMSLIAECKKNDIIKIDAYAEKQQGFIQGHSFGWCGISIAVLK